MQECYLIGEFNTYLLNKNKMLLKKQYHDSYGQAPRLVQRTYRSLLFSLTPFHFYKNSFCKNRESENCPKIKNFVRSIPGSRSRDLQESLKGSYPTHHKNHPYHRSKIYYFSVRSYFSSGICFKNLWDSNHTSICVSIETKGTNI